MLILLPVAVLLLAVAVLRLRLAFDLRHAAELPGISAIERDPIDRQLWTVTFTDGYIQQVDGWVAQQYFYQANRSWPEIVVEAARWLRAGSQLPPFLSVVRSTMPISRAR